jgi:hypothetical protein
VQTVISRQTYTLREAAERVGPVSVRTLYNWEKREGLRITRVAGIPMIFADDLDAFLAKYRPPAAHDGADVCLYR